jgi:hypothetical protein
LVISGCFSRGAEEVCCNFTSGSTYSKHDKESSWGSDFISDIFIGLFNVVQGAHRNISPETYNLCAKQDIATCIEPDGHIKKECTLTK